MNNTILLIDLLTASLEFTIELKNVLAAATAEGRDVTDEEIAALVDSRKALSEEVRSFAPSE